MVATEATATSERVAAIEPNGLCLKVVNMDCAEAFDIAHTDGAEPGAVMVVDGAGKLSPTETPYDRRVVGVISGAGVYRPAITLGGATAGTARMPIALLGRVYCKVEGDYASIAVGDMLTTSATLGHSP